MVSLTQGGEGVRLEPENFQKDELAQRLGVESVQFLNFEGKIRRYKKTGARIAGKLQARYWQACVVSMDLIPQEISIEVDRKFLGESEASSRQVFSQDGELLIDPDDDEPDILEANTIDLWEVLIEELNLAIDPFPRKDDPDITVFSGKEAENRVEGDDLHKPFANLNTLINEKKSKK